MHKNWTKKTNLLDLVAKQAAKRKLEDLTVGPVLSWNNKQIQEHVDQIKALNGA